MDNFSVVFIHFLLRLPLSIFFECVVMKFLFSLSFVCFVRIIVSDHINYVSPHTIQITFFTNKTDEEIESAPMRIEKTRYTTQLSITPMLYEPCLGSPTETLEHLDEMFHVHDKKVRILGKLPYTNVESNYATPYIYKTESLILAPSKIHTIELPHRSYDVRMPPKSYPFSVGTTADLGQTYVSERVIELLKDANLMTISGDLSYADGWDPRWDSFDALFDSVEIPILTVGGNHELYENWFPYTTRWVSPQSPMSESALYWSVDVGPIHFVGLNSYDFSVYQRDWFVRDMESNAKTWTVLLAHVPLYSSNLVHLYEGDDFRKMYEPLFEKYGVHFVFSGHVHAYERSFVNPRTVYLNVGASGSRECLHHTWLLETPEWSKRRISTYGAGNLVFYSDERAVFQWIDMNGTVIDSYEFMQSVNRTSFFVVSETVMGIFGFVVLCISAVICAFEMMYAFAWYMMR